MELSLYLQNSSSSRLPSPLESSCLKIVSALKKIYWQSFKRLIIKDWFGEKIIHIMTHEWVSIPMSPFHSNPLGGTFQTVKCGYNLSHLLHVDCSWKYIDASKGKSRWHQHTKKIMHNFRRQPAPPSLPEPSLSYMRNAQRSLSSADWQELMFVARTNSCHTVPQCQLSRENSDSPWSWQSLCCPCQTGERSGLGTFQK